MDVRHDIHMQDGDAQLPIPAQRSDNDLNVSFLHVQNFRRKMRSLSRLLQSNRECIQAPLQLTMWVFSCCAVGSATRHSQIRNPTSSLCYLKYYAYPQRQHSISLQLFYVLWRSARPCLIDYPEFHKIQGCSPLHMPRCWLCCISTPMDVSTIGYLLATSYPQNPDTRKSSLMMTNLSPISVWLLRIVKSLPFKHAMAWSYAPHVITQHYCKFGISRIPQVSNARIL